MSPGIEGRETAHRVLMLEGGQESEDRRGKKTGKGKKKKRTAADRQSMTAWSWFVAVWGRKPAVEPSATDMQQPDELKDDDDDNLERWWGFCEPEELKRLAAWISNQDETRREAGNDEHQTLASEPPTKAQVKDLVRALEEYAEVLQWLIEREEETDDILEVSTGRRKGGSDDSNVELVPAAKFYA